MKRLICIGLLVLSVVSAQAQERPADPYEARLMAVLQAVNAGALETARTLGEALLRDYPTSRAGAALLGDVYSAMTAPIENFGETVRAADAEYGAGLQREIQLRLPFDNQVPDQGSKVPASILDMVDHPHVMVADLAGSRLYVFRNEQGLPRLMANYYMTIGLKGIGKEVEGDQRTPVGVYRITRFIPDKELPDLYGSGAFPVDYPNVLDKGRERTGYGIWLHGTPSDQYSRVPWASDGCFVVSNRDFEDIIQYIDPDAGTPVVLAESVDWVELEQTQAQAQELKQVIADWEQAWESRDPEQYRQYYQQDQFGFGQRTFSDWLAGRSRVMRRVEFIKLDVAITGVFAYPGEADTVLVQFDQAFESDTYKDLTAKQMYWVKNADGEWKAVFEGTLKTLSEG